MSASLWTAVASEPRERDTALAPARSALPASLCRRSPACGSRTTAAGRAAPWLSSLRAWCQPPYDLQSPLRAALHDLAALEVVRIIEDKA